MRAECVADPVERGDNFAGEAAGFGDNRIDVPDAEFAETKANAEKKDRQA